ncbi:MAG: hypothetical protein D6753_01130 [Planctomycetota bacterium]|nr:MAG: hypothetical protein D6753_01130 [Planctomycetota bacterium]
MVEAEEATRAEQSADSIDALHWGRWRDWLELVRLPLVFTLVTDNIAASVLVAGGLTPLTAWLPLLLASLCAYWGGMILNDVADLEQDRIERPKRPLPSGRISPALAGHVGNALLLIGPVLVLGVVAWHPTEPLWMGAAFVAAVLLSVCVRAYDSWLKRTPLGPILMGACRGGHVLMVGLAMYSLQEDPRPPRVLLVFAQSIGLYIVGVTTYARREAAVSHRMSLALGIVLEMAGLGLLATLPRWQDGQGQQWLLSPTVQFPLLILLISLTVLHRGLRGLLLPTPRHVQLAVKHALLTLILLDAAVVAMWAGSWPGAAVALLVLPSLASSRRLRTT